MATLMIGSSSSQCSSCKRDADPGEEGHYTLLGYGPDNGKRGCMEPWTDAMLVYYWAGRDKDVAEYIEYCWFPDFIKDLLRKRYL